MATLRMIVIVALVMAFVSCSARTQDYSDTGREFSLHFCAIRHECGCAEESVPSDCEERVEREFAEHERQALDAGLVYNPACMERWLEFIDALGTCDTLYPENDALCPVYGANHDAGETCEVYETFPLMYDCRLGLACIDGICTDFVNRPRLPQGAFCSEDQYIVPTGDLGECDEGLQCDSIDTRTCVPVPVTPRVPLGEECISYFGCEDQGICRPQGNDPEPSEERPGICVERTPPGEPCTLVYECDRICENGFCQVFPVAACEVWENWEALHEVF